MSEKIAAGIEEFLTKSRTIIDHGELTHGLMAAAAQFGVEHAVFLEFQKIGDLLVPLNARGSLSPEFGERYIREDIFKIDPFMKKASTDVIPFTWQEGVEAARDSDDTQRFLAICTQFGMTDGLFFPLHTAHGINCWTGFTGSIDLGFKSRGYLQQLALYYSVAMIRIIQLEDTTSSSKVLTARQLECIKWISIGKSDWEIASILGLSESTVNRHVERAKERFGVSTRTQVVVKAIQSGELDLQESVDHVNATILSSEKIRINFT